MFCAVPLGHIHAILIGILVYWSLGYTYIVALDYKNALNLARPISQVHSIDAMTTIYKTCIHVPLTVDERELCLGLLPYECPLGYRICKNNLYDLVVKPEDAATTDYLKIELRATYLNNQLVPFRRCRNKNRKKDRVPIGICEGYYRVDSVALFCTTNLKIALEEHTDGTSFISAQAFYPTLGELVFCVFCVCVCLVC